MRWVTRRRDAPPTWTRAGSDGCEQSARSGVTALVGVLVAAGLLFALIAPYYLLGHIYLPRLRRCEYGYEDFAILPHWEAWSSYLVSPVLAGILTYALLRLTGWNRLWPLAIVVPVAAVVGLGFYTGGANCGD